MKRPPLDPGRFEEHRREELRVEPQFGPSGTEFHFNAFHFEHRKLVKVVIKDPRNHVVYTNSLITDDDGSIGYVNISLITNDKWPLGVYTFSVDGVSETFVLTR